MLRQIPRWFLVSVAAISVLGAGVRVAMVALVDEPSQPGFLVDYDPIFYSQQANLVADGHGFIAPYLLDADGNGPHRPSAGHPPLLVIVLAIASKLGAASFGAHRLITALIGALAIPLIALLAARIAGWRTGVIAAAIAALYPNLWLYDGLLMPEALAGVFVALALLVSFVLFRAGGLAAAIGLGVIIGFAALTRGELLLLVPLLVLPVCLARRDESMGARLRLVLAATLTAGLVIAPWALYNVGRFENPVIISTAQETTIGGANCEPVYFGTAIGAWQDQCFTDITGRGLEESVAAREIRARAVRYAKDHAERLPLVATARVGRAWDVFKAADNVTLGELQRRPRVWSWLALAMFAVLVPAAAVGAVVLRRRKVWALPLLLMPVFVTCVAALFWGNPRFRRPAEIAIIVLAAVAFDAAWRIGMRKDYVPASSAASSTT